MFFYLHFSAQFLQCPIPPLSIISFAHLIWSFPDIISPLQYLSKVGSLNCNNPNEGLPISSGFIFVSSPPLSQTIRQDKISSVENSNKEAKDIALLGVSTTFLAKIELPCIIAFSVVWLAISLSPFFNNDNKRNPANAIFLSFSYLDSNYL